MPDLARTLRLLPTLAEDGWVQLRAQWRQHALTLVGIVWGAAAVVLLLSFGSGLFRFLDIGFKKTGDRHITATGRYTSTELGGARPGRRIALVREDLERVRASVPSAALVSTEYERPVAARTHRRTRMTVVSVGTPDLRWIRVHHVARGRFYDDEDDRLRRPVAVLGANVPEVFFGSDDPIHRVIHLDGRPFDVIGVLERKGQQIAVNNALHDDMIFVPLGAGQLLFGLGDEVGHLIVEPRRLDDLPAVRAELRAALWPHHHIAPEDDQAIVFDAIQDTLAPLKKIGVGLEVMLGFIGTVILAMAAVGVANLMVAIVSQRRTELAMRRACGARRSDVTLQLVAETLVVVLSGGAVGVGIAALAVWAFSWVPAPEIVPLPKLLPRVLVTTAGVLVTVGLAAGLLPARAASRVDPAAALRVR